jgi:hypothetical protein
MRLPEAHLTPDWSQGQLKSRVARALPERVQTYLDPFVKGMQRRLERDLARVYDYFSELGAESVTRQQKLRQPAEMETAGDELRLESIAREYKAKVADLQQTYALRVEVNWSQSLEVVMPVRRVEVIVKRRKGERKIKLDWNPLARKLEAPPCEFSYSQSTRRVVCDDKLHIISPEAHAPCANCHKSYCRACHPLQCPKCHKSR